MDINILTIYTRSLHTNEITPMQDYYFTTREAAENQALNSGFKVVDIDNIKCVDSECTITFDTFVS